MLCFCRVSLVLLPPDPFAFFAPRHSLLLGFHHLNSVWFPLWFCALFFTPRALHSSHCALFTATSSFTPGSPYLFVTCSEKLCRCTQYKGGMSYVCQVFRSVAKRFLCWWCFCLSPVAFLVDGFSVMEHQS